MRVLEGKDECEFHPPRGVIREGSYGALQHYKGYKECRELLNSRQSEMSQFAIINQTILFISLS
jgi:hypothetical protein